MSNNKIENKSKWKKANNSSVFSGICLTESITKCNKVILPTETDSSKHVQSIFKIYYKIKIKTLNFSKSENQILMLQSKVKLNFHDSDSNTDYIKEEKIH